MTHVAREMERQGFKLPLLIGGATTSRAHTAVKIAPHYSQPVVHVLDASRAVPVTTSLLSDEARQPSSPSTDEDYEKLRRPARGARSRSMRFARQGARRTGRPSSGAREDVAGARVHGRPRARRLSARDACGNTSTGRRSSTPGSSRASTRASSSTRPTASRRASSSRRATQLLDTIIAKKLIRRARSYGFFPANAVGDDVELYTDDIAQQRARAASISCASRAEKRSGEPNRSLADFVAPKETRLPDYIGALRRHDRHRRSRSSCASSRPSTTTTTPSWPRRSPIASPKPSPSTCTSACVKSGATAGTRTSSQSRARSTRSTAASAPPPATPPAPITPRRARSGSLLDVEKNTGMKLTESYAMWPGSSVSGLYFAHPASQYFGLGKIDRGPGARLPQAQGHDAGRGRTLARAQPQLRAVQLRPA